MQFVDATAVATLIADNVLALAYIIAILLAGLLLGTFAERSIRRFLTGMTYARIRAGTGNAAETTEGWSGLTGILARLVKYLIFLAALIVVFDKLGLNIAKDILLSVWMYVPNVIAAVIILLLGIVAAEIIAGVVTITTKSSGFDDLLLDAGAVFTPSALFSTIARYFVYAITFTIAITQIGFQASLLTMVVGAIVIATVLFFLALLVYGVRDMMPDIFAGVFLRSSGLVKLGESIEVDGAKGKVKRIGVLTLSIADRNGIVKVANSRVIKRVRILRRQRL